MKGFNELKVTRSSLDTLCNFVACAFFNRLREPLLWVNASVKKRRVVGKISDSRNPQPDRGAQLLLVCVKFSGTGRRADVAEVILDPAGRRRVIIFRVLPAALAADVFEYLDVDAQQIASLHGARTSRRHS